MFKGADTSVNYLLAHAGRRGDQLLLCFAFVQTRLIQRLLVTASRVPSARGKRLLPRTQSRLYSGWSAEKAFFLANSVTTEAIWQPHPIILPEWRPPCFSSLTAAVHDYVLKKTDFYTYSSPPILLTSQRSWDLRLLILAAKIVSKRTACNFFFFFCMLEGDWNQGLRTELHLESHPSFVLLYF